MKISIRYFIFLFFLISLLIFVFPKRISEKYNEISDFILEFEQNFENVEVEKEAAYENMNGEEEWENNKIETIGGELEEKEDNAEDILESPVKIILDNVSFVSQAPFGDWEDPRQQHGCEEVSIVMAHYFLTGEKLNAEVALSEILAISEFEIQKFGHYYDTSAYDTAEVFKEFYGHQDIFVQYDITIEDIKNEIAKGNLMIVLANGRKLQNPHFTEPGPLCHQLIVIGYDDETGEFITNDPGTRYGENYRYDYEIFMNAIRDYKTGIEEPVEEEKKVMIVVEKNNFI